MSAYLKIHNPADLCTDFPSDPAQSYPYPLDPFQQHAVAAISKDENVLVTAKTGSGKTLVGEYQIAHSLRKGGRVFYTTPIKSLSNQKFYDLKQMFPDRVGIMTGDLKFKPDADVVIMTTEILRNLLFKRGTATESLGITASLSLDRLDAVVFDECHYINDRDRGAVWEETMILLPPAVNMVLLSATIDAPEQFAAWLGELKKKPIHLISTQYRVVPLIHGVYREDEFMTVMDSKDQFHAGTYKAWIHARKRDQDAAAQHKDAVADRRLGGYEDAVVKRKATVKSFTHEMNAMIGRLNEKELLPALFFVFSRKDCERYAGLTEHTLLDSSDTASVKHILDFHLHKYGEDLVRIPQYHTIRGLLEKGIAFHHSGLMPILKEMIEILFGRGFVKVLFATETFAVGINMPTKTVIFTGLRKYDSCKEGMRLLNTDEYIQMAGRAGRRGKDDRGIVIYMPDRDPEHLEDLQKILTGARSTFQSRMTFHYDFILKTFQAGNLQWLTILKDSYWFRRHESVVRGCRLELESAQSKQTGLTAEEIEDMEEYEKINRNIKATTNAARRVEQAALEKWKQRRVGPRWHRVMQELWQQYKKTDLDIRSLQKELAALESPQNDILPTLDALEKMGFMAGDSSSLTPLGIMATEVNEGHAILMPLTFERGIKLDSAEEMLAFLAVFLGEPAKDASKKPLQIPGTILKALKTVEEIAATCKQTEKAANVLTATNWDYWELNYQFVEIVWRYVNGEEIAAICADYEIFEGNLIRILLKMGNILQEWQVLATITKNVEQLEMLTDAASLLAVGTIGSESLYLRL